MGAPKGERKTPAHRAAISEGVRRNWDERKERDAKRKAASAYLDLIGMAMKHDREDLVMQVLKEALNDPVMAKGRSEIIDADGMRVVAWRCPTCSTMNDIANSTCECCGGLPHPEVSNLAHGNSDVAVAQRNLINQLRKGK